jgi:predicted nicotinamide N-methyase
MVVSPLAFFHGAATVMAHDLAPTLTAGLRAALAADCHRAATLAR